MNRQFCDRCATDVTDKVSARCEIIADADVQGNGTITKQADLCQPCRQALETWLKTPPAPNGRRPHGAAKHR